MIDKTTEAELIEAARAASERAYAPYSKFRVGAALLTSDGRFISGCNVENGSYGLTICAERVALGRAVAEGAREFQAIAIYTPTSSPTPPCGACRQVLSEFAPRLEVVSACDGADRLRARLDELLPARFGFQAGKED